MTAGVLLVDDDPVIRALLGAVLRTGGYQVHSTDDSDEALRTVRDAAPAVVLVDAMMPDRDGFAVCRAIRGLDLPVQPRIALLTGLVQVPPEQVADAGFDMVLSKPVSPRQVLACVAELVG